jgi:hypothetical protein
MRALRTLQQRAAIIYLNTISSNQIKRLLSGRRKTPQPTVSCLKRRGRLVVVGTTIRSVGKGVVSGERACRTQKVGERWRRKGGCHRIDPNCHASRPNAASAAATWRGSITWLWVSCLPQVLFSGSWGPERRSRSPFRGAASCPSGVFGS